MAYIEVNHNTLNEVAEAILTYCDAQDKEMKSAKSTVEAMLLSDWLGSDASEFQNKWNDVDTSDSVTAKLRESLKSFAEIVKVCAVEYKRAQEDSYNEASRLPR
ncbi:MAG: hypothetical protein NC452_06435 [Eubacterium sp.]|nr:hypothetical protein [Eubacterium sp.]